MVMVEAGGVVMAKEGYLRIALDKKTAKGAPFVSVLIVDDADDTKGGEWYSIFDAWWFKGTEDHPSVYDIRTYASKSNPTKVLFEFTESKDGKFRNITKIRPESEKWDVPTTSNQEPDKDVKGEGGKSTPEQGEAKERGLSLISGAIEQLADGIALMVTERMKGE